MIYRNYLGLDIQSTSLRAVSLRRRRSSYEIRAGRVIGLPEGVLVPGQRQDNILQPAAMVSAIRDVLAPIAGVEERIAVALPDACGRVLLLQVDTPLSSGAEGLDVVRWQLRDTLPSEVPIQIDFQILSTDESGRQRVVVAYTPEHVIQQYEHALVEAGFGAEKVLFRSHCQHNFFRHSLEATEDFLLVIADEDTLVFQAVQAGELIYHRSREIPLSVENVFSELNRVLAGESERLNTMRRAPVFLHAQPEEALRLQTVLESLFERSVCCLDSSLKAVTAPGVSINASLESSLLAAVGAAESLM